MKFAVVSILLLVSAFAEKPKPTTVPLNEESVVTSPGGALFNGWKLSPAGKHARVSDMPLRMILSPDQKTLLAICAGHYTGLAVVDVEKRQTKQFLPIERTFNGLAFSPDGKTIYVTGGNSDMLHVFDFTDGVVSFNRAVPLLRDTKALKPPTSQPADIFLTGIAVHPTTGKLYICCESRGEVWVVNPQTLQVEDAIRVGAFPHSCTFGAEDRYLYVSNWGDRTVSAINMSTSATELTINVGVRPNDLVRAPDGRLFVACAGDNTIHVIETKSLKRDEKTNELAPPPENAMEIISTSLYPSAPEGSTPVGIAVSPDGKALFAVNADNNNAAVIDISDAKISTVVGFVPTGWYPTSVVSDGKTLFIANGKGLENFGPNAPSKHGARRSVLGITFDHPTGMLSGSVSFIDPPTGEELNRYTVQVRENCPFTPDALHKTAAPGESAIPLKVGDPCAIKHVLYIIKENRTYDQVLGDLRDSSGKPIGNGDPKLTLFGEDITPNHHQLAREYVLLDNLYCNGEVSVDGHSWCDGAIATDYRQRSWIVGYTGHGELPGNRDMDEPAGGFIWDLCRRHGVSFKCYGEGSRSVPMANRGNWGGGRDMHRADRFIDDLRKAEAANELPQFMIMSLGEDHTTGSKPGTFTPQACVASNDIALGKIVEAMTRSKFWKESAIFIIEDDAQNGPDHVDSHRTVGLVISPYIKRGMIDSTPYTTTSMIRTMELILGLPPMTQYDAAATPMHACFGTQAKMDVYAPLKPKVDLTAKNTEKSPGAQASAKMDFDEYDEAPEDELNRILWAVVKGEHEPYPTPIHRAIFTR
jgi:YVTN family beta-propeller protein